MADPNLYTYASPLKGYEGLEPLPEYVPLGICPLHSSIAIMYLDETVVTLYSERAEDGKSYVNPLAEKKSEAYKSFVAPITNGIRGGFE